MSNECSIGRPRGRDARSTTRGRLAEPPPRMVARREPVGGSAQPVKLGVADTAETAAGAAVVEVSITAVAVGADGPGETSVGGGGVGGGSVVGGSVVGGSVVGAAQVAVPSSVTIACPENR